MRFVSRGILPAVAALLVTGPAAASIAPDTAEPGSVEAIATATTDPAYLPESVSYVPESSTVPSPTDFLGRIVGAPNELTNVATIHAYFHSMAQKTPRVEVRKIGTSEEGRDIMVVLVSSEANLAASARHFETTRKLADPRNTTDEAMRQLVKDGKVVYYILAGLHSTETGPPEMVMELAYRLAVSEQPEIQRIRDNVIVMITPVVEPDGRDRQVEWYYRHLRDSKLPFHEQRRFSSPPYWGHYAFHDNNRDGMQLTLALTRAVNDMYWEAHPQVVHDLHESLPLLYISTGHGPYSDAVDPVTVNEWTQFAHHEASELQAMGLPGVWTWGFWDGWWPGYLFSVGNNHKSVGRFYETFGNSLAGTFERELEEVEFVGKSVTTEQWYRPWPPDKKVTWSLRNNTNYMQSGVLAALTYAADHRAELLRNFWVKGARSLERGKTEAPFAWIIPEDQKDPQRLVHLINLLRKHRIEVHKLGSGFESKGTAYPSGSYVVRMDQPYRNAAKNFLEEQKFPPNEPNPPYDDVAWTWPLLFGVEAHQIDDKAVLDAKMSELTADIATRGSSSGDGPIFLIKDTGQNALLPARFVLGDRRVEVAQAEFKAKGETYPAGSWIVRIEKSRAQKLANDFGLTLVGVDAAPNVPVHLLEVPRIGVMHTWTSTQDCGWVRYTFDTQGIPYTLLSPDELRQGRLGDSYDVILFPRARGDFARMVHGIDPKYGPLPYVKTAEYPSHGVPNGSPDITGGMGFEGLSNLADFVRGGGVLITLADSGRLPVDGGLARNVNSGSAGRTPGSVVRAKSLQPTHPILYGYGPYPTMFRGNGPVFDVDKEDRGLVVAQFGLKKVGEDDAESAKDEDTDKSNGDAGLPEDKRLVLSGWVQSESELNGKPAILDVPLGRGRVVLFSFNPLHRYLNHADFRYVYNAILNWNDFPGTLPQGIQPAGDGG